MKSFILMVAGLFLFSATAAETSRVGKGGHGYLSGIGVTRLWSQSTGQTGAGNRPRLKFHSGYAVTAAHDIAFKQAFLVAHGYGQFAVQKATAEYYYKPTGGVLASGSDVKVNTATLEFGMGVRFRPFPTWMITPLGGVGGLVGALRLNYNDPSMSTKVTGGEPRSTRNFLFKYGAYAELGMDFRLWEEGPGFEVIAKRKFSRTNKARTLNHEYLDFSGNELTALFVLPF